MGYRMKTIAAMIFLIIFLGTDSWGFTIGRLKYKGGGDWYNDPSIIPELAARVKTLCGIEIDKEQKIVQFEDDSVFETPFIFATGHGNIKFDDAEREKLMLFLKNGGFLYVDDDYGLDEHFRREIESIFGKDSLKELPPDFELFDIYYDFKNEGIPKVHEHYPGPPKTFGIWVDGRLALVYTYNSNVSDGWADVHNDPEQVRNRAFEFGVNILIFFLTR